MAASNVFINYFRKTTFKRNIMNNIEFSPLVDLLSNPNFVFFVADYLYTHDKSSYPLRSEFDAERLFCITEIIDTRKFRAISFTNKEKVFDYSDDRSAEFDFYFQIPSACKKALGIGE